MPAIVYKMGFISNQRKKNSSDEEFQDKIAEGLCQGLLDYFQASPNRAFCIVLYFNKPNNN